MTRRTSADVYRQIQDEGLLSRSRFRVYKALHEHGPLTGKELNDLLDSDSAHKRLSELRDLGAAVEGDVRECRISGRRSIEWTLTGDLPATSIQEGREQAGGPRSLKRSTLEREVTRLQREVNHAERRFAAMVRRENRLLEVLAKIEDLASDDESLSHLQRAAALVREQVVRPTNPDYKIS